jgi:hypothetical protein
MAAMGPGPTGSALILAEVLTAADLRTVIDAVGPVLSAPVAVFKRFGDHGDIGETRRGIRTSKVVCVNRG